MKPAAALATRKFWLLAAICFVGMGSGLTLVNNFAQLAAAARVPGGPALLVSAFSVCNCLGRLLFG